MRPGLPGCGHHFSLAAERAEGSEERPQAVVQRLKRISCQSYNAGLSICFAIGTVHFFCSTRQVGVWVFSLFVV